jgi:DDE family transposase
LVWGAWRGLTDKAKVYFYVRAQHPQEFPTLGAYSKFVEATNRYSVERRALLALMRYRNRQQQGAYPIVSQDSTAIEVCHMARARQHRTFRDWARKSKNGLGWWYGVKLHVQCNEAGRLCGFDLTTATGDDRKLLDPLTRWMQDGIVVGDGGYLSRASVSSGGCPRGRACSRKSRRGSGNGTLPNPLSSGALRPVRHGSKANASTRYNPCGGLLSTVTGIVSDSAGGWRSC